LSHLNLRVARALLRGQDRLFTAVLMDSEGDANPNS
jgi:hypothetical protein